MTANDNRSPESSRDPSGHRGNVAALIALVLVAAALFWLVSALQKHNALQNCIDSGRRDCLPIEPGK